MVVSHADIAEVFQRVLYPLLEALIAAPGNVETMESRLRASVLLCKAFMRFEVSDNVMGEDVTECWMQVLDYLGRLMCIDQSEQLVRFAFLSDMQWKVNMLPSPRLCMSHSKMLSLSCTQQECFFHWQRNTVTWDNYGMSQKTRLRSSFLDS